MGPDSILSAAPADRLPATSGPLYQADRNVLIADALDLELRLGIIHSQFERIEDAHGDRRCVAIGSPPQRRRVPVRPDAASLLGWLFDRYGSGVVTDGWGNVSSGLAAAEPQG